MSTEIATRVIHPFTGQVLELQKASVADLGWMLTELREYRPRLNEALRAVQDEVLDRQDKQATWTTHAGDWILTGSSPVPSEEFDELALRSDLWELVDEGVITQEAVDAAVETVVTYRVRKAGLNKLRKLGGRVQETIDRHARPVEKPRYVNVKSSRL